MREGGQKTLVEKEFAQEKKQGSEGEGGKGFGEEGVRTAEMGKHPDLLVAHPTSTIFTTIGRN